MKKALIWMVLCILMPTVVFSFEGNEHKMVSDLALNIVVHYLKQDSKIKLSPDDMAKLEKLLNGTEYFNKATYGDLSAFADYHMDPKSLFKIWGDFKGLPMDEKGMNIEYLSELQNKASGTLRMLQASHNNVDHFQERLLFTYWWWHKTALLAAVEEKNLWAAMVLNAYADHFVEDFFAPGHMITPREGLHDVASKGLHDYYNEKKGTKLKVKNNQELEPLLNVLDQPEFQEYHEAKIILMNKLTKNQTIEIYGDNKLNENPQQVVFMSVVVARSILDVVESYNDQKTINHYEEFYWKSRRLVDLECKKWCKAKPNNWNNPAMAIRYGEYEEDDAKLVKFSWIYAVSISNQALFTGSEKTSRPVYDIELMPFGTPPSGNFLRDENGTACKIAPQMGFAVGYSFLQDDNYRAHGPTVRLAFPITRLDTTLSLTGAYRHFRGNDVRYTRFSPGVKLEMGFGLLFLNVGFANEYYIKNTGVLENSLAFVGGISFMY